MKNIIVFYFLICSASLISGQSVSYYSWTYEGEEDYTAIRLKIDSKNNQLEGTLDYIWTSFIKISKSNPSSLKDWKQIFNDGKYFHIPFLTKVIKNNSISFSTKKFNLGMEDEWIDLSFKGLMKNDKIHGKVTIKWYDSGRINNESAETIFIRE